MRRVSLRPLSTGYGKVAHEKGTSRNLALIHRWCQVNDATYLCGPAGGFEGGQACWAI
jgi:hypothetical protein